VKSYDPWSTIVTDGSGDILWPRSHYGHAFYQEIPSWIHYDKGDNGTRRLLFDGAFIGAEAPFVGEGAGSDVDASAEVHRIKGRLRALVKDRPWFRGVGIARRDGGFILRLNVASDAADAEVPREFDGMPIDVVRIDGYGRRKVTTMMRPHAYAGHYTGAENPPTSAPGGTEPRKGLLADVAPHVAPATGPITVKKEFDNRQILHVEICVDGKCYRTSMDLAPAIEMVMTKLAQWHKDQHAATGQLPSTTVIVGAIGNAIGAAGDAMADTLVCHHVNVMTGGFFDEAGSSLGETLRALAPVISTVATSVATYYGGPEAGAAAGQLAPVVTHFQANLLDPKGDPAQKAAAQQGLQRVNQVAQTDPRAAQALATAHQAVRDTAVAYHVKGAVDRAVAGDPAARKDVVAVVQAAERGDPAAKSTYEVIAQVLLDKAQHSEWGAQLWERIMGSRGATTGAGWYSPSVGAHFDVGYGWYPPSVGVNFDAGHGWYPPPVVVGSFWDSLGGGVLSTFRTVSTPVTWFTKKVNETIRDNPALKQVVVTAASALATAYGGPAAGQAAAAFAPSIIDSSAETGGDPTRLFEGTKKQAGQASGGDPKVDQALTHAQNAVTQTMAVATLTKIADDASRGDAEALRQINELRARANAGDQVATRAMAVITGTQRMRQQAQGVRTPPQAPSGQYFGGR
jgi:hypothetical protein